MRSQRRSSSAGCPLCSLSMESLGTDGICRRGSVRSSWCRLPLQRRYCCLAHVMPALLAGAIATVIVVVAIVVRSFICGLCACRRERYRRHRDAIMEFYNVKLAGGFMCLRV